MRNAAAMFVAAIACGLMGCAPEDPIKTVSLEMRSQNEFALDGRTVKSSQLRNTLLAMSKSDDKICVTVSAVQSLSNEDALALMKDVQGAGISCVGASGVAN